jgi:amphi-Trp domain-containing protein
MTEKNEKNDASETEAPEADKKDEEAEDEEAEDKEKKKKAKIEFESNMPRSEAVSYFEAIVGGLRSGRLEFRQAGNTLVLSPPERLEIEVKAQQKGEKGKIVFEISWSEEHRSLEILN